MGPPDVPSPMRMTRRDVAKRELVAAIEMFFNDADPIVVHLLVAACEDVCVPVVRAKGLKAFRDEVEERVRPEYLDSWRDRMKAPYIFFKHGGADPDQELDFFDPRTNDMKLFGTITDYIRAFGEIPMQATVFMGWHVATYPELLTEHGVALFGPISNEFAGLTVSGRKLHARALLPAAAIVENEKQGKG